MRREEVSLEKIHNFIQRLFVDAGYTEIRNKTLVIEMNDISHLDQFNITVSLKGEGSQFTTVYWWRDPLIVLLHDLAKVANNIAADMHLDSLPDPKSYSDVYYLNLYFVDASKDRYDILDALRYVSEICEANNARYGIQPLDYTKYCEVLGGKPLEPWKTTCLNKFVINNKKENENMKPTCQMCSPMTKDDIAFKAIMDSVEKERQEKIEAANKEAAEITADYEEKKHLNNIRAEMKDVAVRYRYLYEELIETGFNEEQSMEIMRDYIKFA